MRRYSQDGAEWYLQKHLRSALSRVATFVTGWLRTGPPIDVSKGCECFGQQYNVWFDMIKGSGTLSVKPRSVDNELARSSSSLDENIWRRMGHSDGCFPFPVLLQEVS